jgi:hypothetical protein
MASDSASDSVGRQSQSRSFNSELALYFYQKGADVDDGTKIRNLYTCNCLSITGRKCSSLQVGFDIVKNTGYTNLKTHTIRCIPEWEMKYDQHALQDEDRVNNVVDRVRPFKSEHALYFYEKGADVVDGTKMRNLYRCNCLTITGRKCSSSLTGFNIVKGTGYTNLKNHTVQCIPEWETKYDQHTSQDEDRVADRVNINLSRPFKSEHALYFYEKGDDAADGTKIRSFYACKSLTITGRKCCSSQGGFNIIKNSGYTNLKSHTERCIPEWVMKYDQHTLKDGNVLNSNPNPSPNPNPNDVVADRPDRVNLSRPFISEHALYFYHKGPDVADGTKIRNLYRCDSLAITGRKCKSSRAGFNIRKKTGYTNLKNHTAQCIPEWEMKYDQRAL